jgi:hypothetical protein
MTKIAGSGSGSISQRHGSADPDPDQHQNVMDPQHCCTVTGRWVAKLARLLATAPLWIRIQTSFKNTKMGDIRKGGQHNVARQKNIQKKQYCNKPMYEIPITIGDIPLIRTPPYNKILN